MSDSLRDVLASGFSGLTDGIVLEIFWVVLGSTVYCQYLGTPVSIV